MTHYGGENATYSRNSNCLKGQRAMADIVVLLGDQPVELYMLEDLANQFDWSLVRVKSLSALRSVDPAQVVAVILEPAALELPWETALAAARKTLPHTPLIVCH